jgi:CDP-glycerol glycerophosphotransferase
MNIKKFKRRIKRKITLAQDVIVFLLTKLLTKLIPRSNNLVIFGAGKGKLFSDNTKYLYLQAIKDPDIKAVWITKNKKLYEKLKAQNYCCELANSFKGKITQLRAKVAVCSYGAYSDFRGRLLGGAIVVNLWHGVGLKKVIYAHSKSPKYKRYYHPNRLRRYINRTIIELTRFKRYYLVSTSPKVSSYYPETFLVKPENVIEMGQARNDIFYDQSLVDKHSLPTFFHQGKRIITYMPTHRLDGKKKMQIDSILDLEALNNFCKANNCLFLIKTHFYAEKLRLEDYESIINFGGADIDPQVLLKYTDVLITDYSSCYTDFLLLDRPVLFYCYDYDWYITSDRELYHDYDEVTPGPRCKTFEELLFHLEEIAKGLDKYKQERKRVLDIFYSPENRGPVAAKQWLFIKSCLKEGK